MKRRMGLATAAAVAALALIGAGPASADPNKNGFTFDITCDTLGTVTIFTFSQGAASPGLVVDSNEVILVYEFEADITFTPTGGEPRPIVATYSRAEPQNERLDHCTFHYERTLPNGVAVVDGWFLISYTP
jgi:hypothetical protein